MPIQTATFTAQTKICQGLICRDGRERSGGRRRGEEWGGRRQGRVKGHRMKGVRDGLRPKEVEQRDKTGKAPFHLSNYVYLSLAHKQTQETNGTE